jgi:hypothetical protein
VHFPKEVFAQKIFSSNCSADLFLFTLWRLQLKFALKPSAKQYCLLKYQGNSLSRHVKSVGMMQYGGRESVRKGNMRRVDLLLPLRNGDKKKLL